MSEKIAGVRTIIEYERLLTIMWAVVNVVVYAVVAKFLNLKNNTIYRREYAI